MKILAIGYYDDFARFFLEIKQLLQNKEKVDFRYLSLYFSGFLYFLVRLQSVVFLPLRVRLSVLLRKRRYQRVVEQGVYRGVDLHDVIRYHLLLDECDENALLLQAVGYIEYYEAYFKKFMPDVLLLSGDSRLSIQILDRLAKQKSIKTYYFEQGPFGTTIWDSKGVNANASLRDRVDFPAVDDASNVNAFLHRQKRAAHKRNPIYRGSDYIFQTIFSYLGLLPADIKMGGDKPIEQQNYDQVNVDMDYARQKTILLILQVPYDVNMVYHSPLFSNHFDIVKSVYESLPADYQLVVREHPLYKQRYESALYQFMRDEGIALDGVGLADAMQSAAVVVVNNSTVGIEAIAIGKPVVVLGNCYYDNADIAFKLCQLSELPALLNKAIAYRVNTNKVERFLHYFLFEFLVDGHFRDADLVASEIITNEVMND